MTAKDFAVISLDTLTRPDATIIVVTLQEDKIRTWAHATERRSGNRIGFVYNDSVIMAPTIHSRIESGRFTIESPDRHLILRIYSSLSGS